VNVELLAEIDGILDRGGEPDDVLREAVQALADSPDIAWAGIAFLDEGALILGPSAGKPTPSKRVSVPIAFQGSSVGELWVDGAVERRTLERIADRLSGHVLIGWDTGGEAWDP
jgi:putative methionine-R-sulfoxide reductase with GAF domain